MIIEINFQARTEAHKLGNQTQDFGNVRRADNLASEVALRYDKGYSPGNNRVVRLRLQFFGVIHRGIIGLFDGGFNLMRLFIAPANFWKNIEIKL